MPGAKPQPSPLTLMLTSDRYLLMMWRVFLLLCAIAVGITISQVLYHGGWQASLAGIISAVGAAALFVKSPAPQGFREELQLQLTEEQFVLHQPDQKPIRGEWQLHWQFPGLAGLKLGHGPTSRIIWLTPRRTGRHGWHGLMQLLTLSGRATPV